MVLANDYFRLSDLPLDFSYQDEGASKAQTPRDNSVTLKDVRFAYPEKPEQLILNDIVLAIPAGKFIGIAGPSGCGKSSLIKVIDKLEEAQGEVLLGGVPLDSLSRTILAENVALVPQTPFLIADTVYHNICYGMKREVSPEEVREAARKANIAADIEQLEGGYQFVLAEGGTNLSGGQRQRIALARIFLKKTPHPDTGRGHLRAGQHLRKAHPGRDRENERGMRHHGSLHRAPPVHPCKTATRSSSWTRAASCSGAPAASWRARRGCFGTWRWGFANKLMKRVGFSPDAPLFYRFCWEIMLMRPPASIMPRWRLRSAPASSAP